MGGDDYCGTCGSTAKTCLRCASAAAVRLRDLERAAAEFLEAWDHQLGVPYALSRNALRGLNELRAAVSPEGITHL